MRKLQPMTVLLETTAVDEILDKVGPPWETLEIDGVVVTVKMNSLRLQAFQHSRVCVACGLAGILMRLEYCHKSNPLRPHWNMYAVKEGELVLMTQDHIIPVSKGGPDIFSNIQTMCSVCNGLKSDRV